MSNHPHAKAPGNVPLWRCKLAGKCQYKHCWKAAPHPCNYETSGVWWCSLADREYAGEICGFRTPPRCEDCGWYTTLACRKDGLCGNYTPRATAEDDLIRVICDETLKARGTKP